MKYYIEITLRYDPEIGLGFLWKRFFTQIHLALVEYGKGDIGVSFPGYQESHFPLGDRLRLFGYSINNLENLKIDTWMNKLQDYLYISEIKQVPEDIATHVRFVRRQPKIDFMKRVAKQAKRHNKTIKEALEHFKNYDKDNYLKLPYINMYSQTHKENFPLFIDKIDEPSSLIGKFDTYGLSKSATVPWF